MKPRLRSGRKALRLSECQSQAFRFPGSQVLRKPNTALTPHLIVDGMIVVQVNAFHEVIDDLCDLRVVSHGPLELGHGEGSALVLVQLPEEIPQFTCGPGANQRGKPRANQGANQGGGAGGQFGTWGFVSEELKVKVYRQGGRKQHHTQVCSAGMHHGEGRLQGGGGRDQYPSQLDALRW